MVLPGKKGKKSDTVNDKIFVYFQKRYSMKKMKKIFKFCTVLFKIQNFMISKRQKLYLYELTQNKINKIYQMIWVSKTKTIPWSMVNFKIEF